MFDDLPFADLALDPVVLATVLWLWPKLLQGAHTVRREA